MQVLFYVKTKVLYQREPGKPPKTRPMSTWLEEERSYPVHDVYTFREKKPDGGWKVNTLFLLGDEKTGRMDWVDASILVYLGDKNEGKCSNIGGARLEEI